MKIINLIGGLGNQMFDYAFSLALKKHYPNEDVLLDIQHLDSLYAYGFELKKVFPDIECQIASKDQIKKVSRYITNYKLSRFARKFLPNKETEFVEKVPEQFEPKVFELKGDVYYEGYWHSYRYYENIISDIQNNLAFPTPNFYNSDMAHAMKECDSVGLHVRRGDYNDRWLKACDLSYYTKAISFFKNEGLDHHFFIFSNDIDWCKQEILPLIGNDRVTFVSENTGINSCWDMYLMSQCKNLIIANSTFSWWGAILNKNNPNVIMPEFWKVGVPSDSLCAPHWIRL